MEFFIIVFLTYTEIYHYCVNIIRKEIKNMNPYEMDEDWDQYDPDLEVSVYDED